MLLATFMFTLMKVSVKLVPHIPAIEVILFRSVISLVISVYYLQRQRVAAAMYVSSILCTSTKQFTPVTHTIPHASRARGRGQSCRTWTERFSC